MNKDTLAANAKLAELARQRAAQRVMTHHWYVDFYDEKWSRKGEGVRRQRFLTRVEAESFAKGRIVYGRPARAQRSATIIVTSPAKESGK